MFRPALASAACFLLLACNKPEPAVSPPPLADAASPTYTEALRARLGGDQVTLTLEPRLQAAAEQAVRASGKTAALVAIAPESGDVLALFSVPGERGDPLLVAHPPASTFKTVLTLAALEAGALTPTTSKTCTGSYDFEGQTFTCMSAHGALDASKALAVSCNGFFYEVATAVAPERVRDTASRLGFGERTGIELGDEPGVVPDPAEARRADRLLDAVGHGKYRVTLLQLARAYAALVNGGKLQRLGVVRARRNSHGTLLPTKRPLERALEFSAPHLELVRTGLLATVAADYGRAHEFAIPGLAFAGKTGGADAPPLPGAAPDAPAESDGWFLAYAPADAPKILVAARVERKGDVAPPALVKAVLEAWRDANEQR